MSGPCRVAGVDATARPVDVRQARRERVAVDHRVLKQRLGELIVGETRDVDDHPDFAAAERRVGPVVEVGVIEVPRAVGQAGVKDQPQRFEQRALARPVLADEDQGRRQVGQLE